ncbi:MAG TPA: hypothetical protein VE913_02435, partial [Longimicrobium sp.]|nr:hypothetical protein [Longimicrobium sp.]
MHIRPSKLLWMLLSVAILGCRDSIGPSVRMPSNAAPGVNIIARLDCSAEIRTNIVTCAAARPERSANGPSLGLLGTGQIKVRSFNVSSDTINGILQADVDVANLLPEVVGTLDGTTVTGIKVFHHSGPTVTKYFNVGDTGRVVVHNAEGYRFFTNPNQPYFQYDTILATNDTSAAKLWQWKYSRTVSNFAFTLMVEANLPSEARVPGYPPDTV